MLRVRKVWFAVLFLVILTGSTGAVVLPVQSPPQVEPVQKPGLSDRLRRIKLTDLDGQSLTLADFSGKPVFLNFWATWCTPCIQEMSSIEQIYRRYGDEVVFLAASHEELEVLRAFRDHHQFTFPIVRLDVDYIDAFVITLPTTLLIDATGELRYEEEGMRVWHSANVVRKVRELIP